MIRCEKCSTLYELDDALLSTEGSPVQCTRCQHVFTALPSATSVPSTPAVRPDREPAAVPTSAPAVNAAPPNAKSRGAVSGGRIDGPRAPADDLPRAPRQGGPAVYRPPPGQAAGPVMRGPTRPPGLRRDTLGAFESRLRRSARWKWLGPALAVAAVVVAGGAGWLLVSHRAAGPSAARSRAGALALIALDDAASLDRASEELAESGTRDPRNAAAQADRALALLLRAGGLEEEAEPLAARAAARTAEHERLRREQPPGWEAADRAAAGEADALAAQVRTREEHARTLRSAAAEALARTQGQQGAAFEIARAEATRAALEGDRVRLERIAGPARGGTPADPWLALAAAALDARAPERAARERAAASLGGLAARHPELLRARVLLARTQGSLGHRAEALASLDSVLATNPRHEGALALRAELSRAAPAPAAAAAPSPATAPAPAPAPVEAVAPTTAAGKPALLPRKPVSLPSQPSAPAAAAALPPATASTPGAAQAPAALSDPSATQMPPALVPSAAPASAIPEPTITPTTPRSRSWPADDESDVHPGGG